MPFKRIPGSKNYISDHGKTYTPKQVHLYGMTNGFKEMDKATKLRKSGKKNA